MHGISELLVTLMLCITTLGIIAIIGLLFWTMIQRNQSMAPCVHCGATMRPGDNFCANCGKPRAGRSMDVEDV